MAIHIPTPGLDEIRALAADIHSRGKRLVVTSGCFDLLHYGHVRFLQQSRQLGDVLVVLVSVDEDIRALKGPSRPIVPGWERANIVDALASVDEVILHAGNVLYELLAILRPHHFTKGMEYQKYPEYLATIRPHVGEITFIDRPEDSMSTTRLIERCREAR
ncbi:MAG TPA: adenylyltransferase/cytidyltransferase family protein [Archangium sp.]|uniref:adenylyltransferase/cytidyltransferase family protein n=1 Tax=Archangium sp. TaxID=1872627 RepID=UPI002E347D64|nr:adenylyltransferase/cytidyltransferase family protein [Archangium sp.]HEX5748112.1 adenylyltransferase/cytidyltransferase family protein [Archangium sp.]